MSSNSSNKAPPPAKKDSAIDVAAAAAAAGTNPANDNDNPAAAADDNPEASSALISSPKKKSRRTNHAARAGLASVALLQLGGNPKTTGDAAASVAGESARGATTTANPTTPRHGNHHPTTTTTTTSATNSGKKRPYRRTKRPANYCDKSTVTTLSDQYYAATMDEPAAPLNSNPHAPTSLPTYNNAFDIVLQESQDLMQAAAEAQQLGRLKMASTYLLLLHARLVGMGKRFDKNVQQEYSKSDQSPKEQTYLPELSSSMEEDDEGDDNDKTKKRPKKGEHHLESPPRLQSTVHTNEDDNNPNTTNNNPNIFTPKTAAAKQLASMLPNNIEMDQAMINHLARAAAQLHAARSGKSRQLLSLQQQQDSNHTSDLLLSPGNHPNAATASPGRMMNARDFLAQTANQKGIVTNPSAASKYNNSSGSSSKNNKNQNNKDNPSSSVSFTVKEHELLRNAVAGGQKPNIAQLATLTGRNAVQIQAYFTNWSTKNRILQDHLGVLHEEEDNNNTTTDTAADGSAKKGGRGRKPATTAINTVPNAVCDARTLLQGNLLLAYRNQNGSSHDEENDSANPTETKPTEAKDHGKEGTAQPSTSARDAAATAAVPKNDKDDAKTATKS